jgi:hypothetical protein
VDVLVPLTPHVTLQGLQLLHFVQWAVSCDNDNYSIIPKKMSQLKLHSANKDLSFTSSDMTTSNTKNTSSTVGLVTFGYPQIMPALVVRRAYDSINICAAGKLNVTTPKCMI